MELAKKYITTIVTEFEEGQVLDGTVVRKLTLQECFRFFGFPDDFKKPGAEGELYKRIGNSVCVPVVEAIAEQMLLT